MNWDEIEVPKEIRPIMPEQAEETNLGLKNGATKQFRLGNLHIREYDDKFLIHIDKVDPRKDPLGHLLFDAPEFLVGLASGIFGGKKFASIMNDKCKNSNTKNISVLSAFFASIFLGYLGYSLTKKIKNF